MQRLAWVVVLVASGTAAAAPKDPQLAAAQKVQREVAGLKRKLKAEKCPAQETDANLGGTLTLYRDKQGRVRRSVEVDGSEDSVSTYDTSYDANGIMRFVNFRQARVGTGPIRDKLYFDETGAVIWTTKDPDEQVVRSPLQHLLAPGAAVAPKACPK